MSGLIEGIRLYSFCIWPLIYVRNIGLNIALACGVRINTAQKYNETNHAMAPPTRLDMICRLLKIYMLFICDLKMAGIMGCND